MRCPYCGSLQTQVQDSRLTDDVAAPPSEPDADARKFARTEA
jgi:hypothetical protein